MRSGAERIAAAMTAPLPASAPVAVVGAGTMGTGIAQLACLAGHRTILIGTPPETLDAARRAIAAGLEILVGKGRLDAAARDAALARLETSGDIAAAAPAGLAIEAVPEDMDLKHRVLLNSDVAVAPDAILAIRQGRIKDGEAFTAERMDIEWGEGRGERIGWRDCLRFKRRIEWTTYGTGDFLMASRKAWEVARGYDESLARHRIGCDRRGAAQLEAHGLTLRRLGQILHMAHPTSCTEGVRPHHGELASIEGVPYRNGEGWGLGDCREVEVAERVWRLERI